MNQVLIVSYDLHSPGQNYEKVIGLIKNHDWVKVGGSVYLICTDSTPQQVRDTLVRALELNDKLFVGVCPAPSAWYGMPDQVTQWIHTHQPQPFAPVLRG